MLWYNFGTIYIFRKDHCISVLTLCMECPECVLICMITVLCSLYRALIDPWQLLSELLQAWQSCKMKADTDFINCTVPRKSRTEGEMKFSPVWEANIFLVAIYISVVRCFCLTGCWMLGGS